MEESIFESEFMNTSGSASLIPSSEPDDRDYVPRVAALAVVMCVCLVAMVGMVAVVIIAASDLVGGDFNVARTEEDIDSDLPAIPRPIYPRLLVTPPVTRRTTPKRTSTAAPIVKEIICTITDTATSESMYPPDKYCDYLFYIDVVASVGRIVSPKNPSSWKLFQQMAPTYSVMKLGISFDVNYVGPTLIHGAAPHLDQLRSKGIKHYGMLTVLSIPATFNVIVFSTRQTLEKLKELQGGDPTAKTIVAIGCYDHSGDDFADEFAGTFTEVVNSYGVDIVIAITSIGWMGRKGFCDALPPTVLSSRNPRYPGLLSHWYAVSPQAKYTKPSTQVGLSFDLSTLQYVLEESAPSLNESILSPCESVERKSREVLCEHGFKSKAENYFGDETYAYGALYNASKVVAMSEYNDSVALKFNTGLRNHGIRHSTAWLFYNVHEQDFNFNCPDPPYAVIKNFCMALKGQTEPRCQ